MVRAVLLKDILWPQKQEDRQEGGWKTNPTEKQACDISICEPKRSLSILSRRRTRETEEERGDMEQTGFDGPSEPKESGPASDSNMPAIAERLIEESIRGRGEKQNDDIV